MNRIQSALPQLERSRLRKMSNTTPTAIQIHRNRIANSRTVSSASPKLYVASNVGMLRGSVLHRAMRATDDDSASDRRFDQLLARTSGTAFPMRPRVCGFSRPDDAPESAPERTRTSTDHSAHRRSTSHERCDMSSSVQLGSRSHGDCGGAIDHDPQRQGGPPNNDLRVCAPARARECFRRAASCGAGPIAIRSLIGWHWSRLGVKRQEIGEGES
jgi:hypothetical protein